MACRPPGAFRPQRWAHTLLATLSVALVSLVAGSASPGAAAGYADLPANPGQGHLGEAVEPSTPDQIALVEHLRRVGAIFWGAWWCPHCFHQKNLFGTEGGQRLPYVECDRDEAGRQRCTAAGIRAYPTWEFKGERREGVMGLEELKQWTGFPATPQAPQAGVSSSTGTKPAPGTKPASGIKGVAQP